MIRATDLRKTYRGPAGVIEAVAGVTITVAAGEFMAIRGRSGSGKSTALAMLGGLLRPTAGRVEVNGTDLFALRPGRLADFRRRHFGVVLQSAGLLPTLRVIDNVALPALIAGSTTDAYARAADLLTKVGLGDRLTAYPAALSGGEQRRAAIARGLINNPPILLADEPTADLDPATAGEVLAVLLDLHRRHRTTLVLVTHDEGVAGHADRVIHLDRGRIVSESEPERQRRPEAGPSLALRLGHHQPVREARLGAGFGTAVVRAAAALALGAGVVAAADHVAATLLHRRADRAQTTGRELEAAALRQLWADIERIEPEPDGHYTAIIRLRNLGETPLFFTPPAVRAFVQVDRDWVEVPAEPADPADGVVEVTDRQAFRIRFRPDVPRFAELVPGYRHVRFTAATLVGRDRTGAGGLHERADDHYVYLKDRAAADADICKRNGWATAPLWIGMPAH